MAFAAGALVFPGGRIDEADRRLAVHTPGADGATVAAIRETIEETAIPVGLSSVPDASKVRLMQEQLAAGRDFGDILADAGLSLAPPDLTAFARWVPKFHAVRRFDTVFYVAKAPAGDWEPRVIEGECAAAYWLSASAILDREQRGEAVLIFPTRRNLERLAQHSRFEEIRADAKTYPVEPVTPWVEERNGEKFITIPSHLGYPVTEEKLDGRWRG